MTLTTDKLGGGMTSDEVRAQVDRMVMSDTFKRSPQLGAFLRFVVEAVLHGKSDRIKAYTIGVEVLRRNTNFDPQLDPIVRVEATRLRRAIERYYSGPGVDDQLVVDLPRGAYVPIFCRKSVDALDIAAAVTTPRFSLSTRRLRVAAAVLATLAVVAAFGLILRQHSGEPASKSATVPADATQTPNADTRYPGTGMPNLAIERFDVVGSRNAAAISDIALYEKMRDAFARFDAVNVVTASATPAGVDFRFRGFVDYLQDGTTTTRFRLIDEADHAVVWSSTTERIVLTRDHDAIEDSLVLATAATLLQPFGVIHTRARVKHLAAPGGDARYRCILEASESLRSFDSDSHIRARTCLERLTTEAPGFVVGMRYLAAVYLREFLFGSGPQPGAASALDQALRVARRAVELHPEGSRPYNTLASVYLAKGDVAQALAASERAVALNRYDMAVLGDFGGRLISAGDALRW